MAPSKQKIVHWKKKEKKEKKLGLHHQKKYWIPSKKKKKKREKNRFPHKVYSSPFSVDNGDTYRIGQEIQYLPYAGFLSHIFKIDQRLVC